MRYRRQGRATQTPSFPLTDSQLAALDGDSVRDTDPFVLGFGRLQDATAPGQ
jgi:hypothetical protein